MIQDLHELPKFKDGLSYIYIERSKIEQDGKSIACYDEDGIIKIPCASLAQLMLGPGTSITHEAIKTLANNGCLVIWTGEEGVRFYARGQGKTRKATKIQLQAMLVSDPKLRLEVVKRMYKMRFPEEVINDDVTIEKLRGMEGVRVRGTYARMSKKYGIQWQGRNYSRDSWASSDPINKALSCANSCLYGICHSAIITAGYSTALGFIHSGKQLSFVYDIADLYKTEISIPVAFEIVSNNSKKLESDIRKTMRDYFKSTNLLAKIIPDIDYVLDLSLKDETAYDSDPALPAPLWNGKEISKKED